MATGGQNVRDGGFTSPAVRGVAHAVAKACGLAAATALGASLLSIGAPAFPQELSGVTLLQKSECDPDVIVFPLATALTELEVIAACDAGQRVDIAHQGLRVGAILDDAGRAVLVLPALTPVPEFEISIGMRVPVTITAEVLDFDDYKRVVLLAEPAAGFELHAYEDGAVFGEAGHVWPDQAYDSVRALVGDGGYLQKVGTPSLTDTQVAQVYTAPTAIPSDATLEIAVTEANCGREISATTITPVLGAPSRITPWHVDMPSCDAVGEIVFLGQVSPAAGN